MIKKKQPCPQCGKEYEKISLHWAIGSCDYPKISKIQHEIATGMLMGDAATHVRDSGKTRIQAQMVSPNFLEWVNEKFGWAGGTVYLDYDAEESAHRHRESGFGPEARGENYQDVYMWYTKYHPEFNIYNNWYVGQKNNGQRRKVFPEAIVLTPTVLLIWYCCDGGLSNKNGSSIQIATSNESENKQKIEEMFTRAGLPKPNRWNEFDRTRKEDGHKPACSAHWYEEQSEKLFEYMKTSQLWDGPPPDFGYKFPEGGLSKTCRVCGKTCKSNRGRKIHESKIH